MFWIILIKRSIRWIILKTENSMFLILILTLFGILANDLKLLYTTRDKRLRTRRSHGQNRGENKNIITLARKGQFFLNRLILKRLKVFLLTVFKIDLICHVLTLRRAFRKVTPRRACRHTWRFQGKRWPRVSKLTPTFWQILEIKFLNRKKFRKIDIYERKIDIYNIMCLRPPAWLICHLFNTIFFFC